MLGSYAMDQKRSDRRICLTEVARDENTPRVATVLFPQTLVE
jgi:hypothetical protein